MVLIDMDRLRKELMAKGDIPIHEVFNTIWEQPIVNVSQPKVGKWIKTYEPNDAEPFILWECSKCQNAVRGRRRSKYCPNCGSYNGGEQNDK